MANVPSLSELTSGQGDANLAFGSGYGGGVPLNLDLTKAAKSFIDITDAQTAKKQKDKAEFEKNLTTKLSSIGKTDGIHPNDIAEINKRKKDVMKTIIDNSYVFSADGALKHPEKLVEVESKVNDYISYVDKSKADKKFETEYLTSIRSKPEYNNDVSIKLLNDWRTKTAEERQPFAPIDDGSKEFDLKDKAFFSTRQNVDIEEVIDPLDEGKIIYKEKSNYDPMDYEQMFKSTDKGRYEMNKYAMSPELQAQYEDIGGVNAYLSDVSKVLFRNRGQIVYKTERRPNVSYVQGKISDRQDKSLDFRGEQNDKKQEETIRKKQEDERKKKELENEKKYDGIRAVSNAIDNVSETISYPVPKEMSNTHGIEQVDELDETTLSYNLTPLYSGGAAKYGDAYGKLYRLIKTDGSVVYAPAKEEYTVKKKVVSKKEFDDAPNNDDKYKINVPDLSNTYTKKDLVGKLIGVSDKKVFETGGEDIDLIIGNKRAEATPPNLVKQDNGQYKPAEGYKWENPNDVNNYNVVKIEATSTPPKKKKATNSIDKNSPLNKIRIKNGLPPI